ncbi:MAG: hypothetical protein ACK4UJ_05990 [Leptonema sp. (in: bacteria)]
MKVPTSVCRTRDKIFLAKNYYFIDEQVKFGLCKTFANLLLKNLKNSFMQRILFQKNLKKAITAILNGNEYAMYWKTKRI